MNYFIHDHCYGERGELHESARPLNIQSAPHITL